MKTKTIIAFASLIFSGVLCAQPLAGCYTVGIGGAYTSLTNVGGFFSAVNSQGLSGNVLVKISSDLTESGAITLSNAAGGFSITIVPNDNTGPKTITLNNSTMAFNNASNVMIDGRYGGTGCTHSPVAPGWLVFTSTLTALPVISLRGDCVNFKLYACTIQSKNAATAVTSSGALNIGTNSSHVTGCDGLEIRDCIIEDPGSPYTLNFGIEMRSPSTTGQSLTGMIIKNNHFINIRGKGIQVLDSGNGIFEGAVISNNHFYGASVVTGPGSGFAHAAIEVESGHGYTIRGNFIGGTLPYCGGSVQNYAYAGGTTLATLIRLQGSLMNSTPNMVDSNVISNIHITGSTSDNISFSFIRSESGNNNIGTVYGNTIGDLISDVSSSTPPVTFDGNNSSYSCRLIYNTTNGTVNIRNNRIGGILFDNSASTSGGNIYLFYWSSSGGGSIINNTIGGVSGNIIRNDNGNFRVIYSDNENFNLTIRGNVISGFRSGTNYSGNFNAILCTSGSGIPSITSNTVQNIMIGSSGTSLSPRTELISTSKQGSIVDSNVVTNIQVYTSSSSTNFSGIVASISGGTGSISNNTISNILVGTGSASVSRVLNGIITSSSSNYMIGGNRITQLYSTASSNSTIRGIHSGASGTGTTTIFNNVILIDNSGNTGAVIIYGISDAQSSGTVRVYHNTCDIRGMISSGSSNSSAYYRSADCVRSLVNNVFTNKRSGGSGSHYAIYNNTAGGTFSSNYNLLYVEADANRLARHSGSNRNFAAWQSFGFDANGLSASGAQTFVQFANGMLSSTVGIDVGTSGTGVNFDIIGSSRLSSVPDMGAYETSLMTVLPVELVYFGARSEGDKVAIEWRTAAEVNNCCYSVEKSTDGISYELLETVPANNGIFSRQLKNYTCYDQPGTDGLIYYRLAQIDKDGTTNYSKSVLVNLELAVTNIVISPNPAGEYAELSGDTENIISVYVYDGSGRLVASFLGDAKLKIDLHDLDPGSYNLQCVMRNKALVHKKLIRISN